MTRAAFRQADIEHIIRAAKATGTVLQIDRVPFDLLYLGTLQ